MNNLVKTANPKQIFKSLMKTKGIIDSLGFNFGIDIQKSLFLFKKDKNLITKINKKMSEINIDIAELMRRVLPRKKL